MEYDANLYADFAAKVLPSGCFSDVVCMINETRTTLCQYLWRSHLLQ